MIACADSLRASRTPRARAALDTLRSWDDAARRWRVAPTLYRSWYATLERRWHAAGLPGYVLARLDGRAGPLADAPRETPAAGTVAALDSAIADLSRLLGPSLVRWTWARAHRARFSHALTGVDRSRRWEPTPIPVDGDNSTVCVGPSRLPRGVDVTHAPVFRHLVDLAVPESSWVASPPGEAAGATDLLAAWANHAYVPLYLSWDRAVAARREVLTLAPGRK
jgi:acyl-homoserine lactone acylase PvdQ